MEVFRFLTERSEGEWRDVIDTWHLNVYNVCIMLKNRLFLNNKLTLK